MKNTFIFILKSSWKVLVEFFTTDINDVISKEAKKILNSEDRDAYLEALRQLRTCDRVEFIRKNGERVILVTGTYRYKE